MGHAPVASDIYAAHLDPVWPSSLLLLHVYAGPGVVPLLLHPGIDAKRATKSIRWFHLIAAEFTVTVDFASGSFKETAMIAIPFGIQGIRSKIYPLRGLEPWSRLLTIIAASEYIVRTSPGIIM